MPQCRRTLHRRDSLPVTRTQLPRRPGRRGSHRDWPSGTTQLEPVPGTTQLEPTVKTVSRSPARNRRILSSGFRVKCIPSSRSTSASATRSVHAKHLFKFCSTSDDHDDPESQSQLGHRRFPPKIMIGSPVPVDGSIPPAASPPPGLRRRLRCDNHPYQL